MADLLEADGAFISIARAAEILGIHKTSAYVQLRTGTFPIRTVMVGSTLKVRSADMRKFIEGDA